MSVRRLSLLLALATLLAIAPFASAQDFFLKKGDVVVVMGDSITEQRLYSNYFELWCQTRFPSYNLVFRNVGISGDRSTGGNSRFKRDVLSQKPTVLTIDFGMNDGTYIWVGKKGKGGDKDKEFTQADVDKNYDVYMKGQQGIADQAKAAKIRVAWFTPQPVEDNPGAEFEEYNKTLGQFSDGVKEIAKKNDGAFADQFNPYWSVIHKARAAGEKKRITGGDRVHPGPPGQALMAALILKGLKFPKKVSLIDVQFDGDKLFGVRGTKSTASEPKAENGSIRFMRKDASLPFFPEQAKGILKWTPMLEDMNEYTLMVTNMKPGMNGLPPGKYEVKLGGKKVGEYTDKQLNDGVNLAGPALATGPVADQVKEVVKAVTDKTNYFHDQIFSLMRANKAANNPAYEERMKKMPEFDAAIRKALEPRSHLVEIVPAK